MLEPQPTAKSDSVARIAKVPNARLACLRRTNGNNSPARATVEATPHILGFAKAPAVTTPELTVSFTTPGVDTIERDGSRSERTSHGCRQIAAAERYRLRGTAERNNTDRGRARLCVADRQAGGLGLHGIVRDHFRDWTTGRRGENSIASVVGREKCVPAASVLIARLAVPVPSSFAVPMVVLPSRNDHAAGRNVQSDIRLSLAQKDLPRHRQRCWERPQRDSP